MKFHKRPFLSRKEGEQSYHFSHFFILIEEQFQRLSTPNVEGFLCPFNITLVVWGAVRFLKILLIKLVRYEFSKKNRMRRSAIPRSINAYNPGANLKNLAVRGRGAECRK